MRNDIFNPFEQLAFFSKKNLKIGFGGSQFALDERVKRALRNGVILELKKGLYVTNLFYLREMKKSEFREFVASALTGPSYISTSYVLSKYGLLTEAVYPVTSVTVKNTGSFKNFLGTYTYSNVKDSLFFGFDKKTFYGNQYFMATKAKALFDFLYLKRNLGDVKDEIREGLRINWENFSKEDYALFREYVKRSGSGKMEKISQAIGELYV